MNYNFDEVIDRRNTDCLKYDFAEEMGVPEDVLSLWVADMDFRTAKPIRDALAAQAQAGIYGYTGTLEDYDRIVCGWYERRFGWKAKGDWIVKTPGVVFALAMCVRAYTQPGETVLIQQPVYYPFYNVIAKNGRRPVNNPLVLENGSYRMDPEDLERKICEENVRMMILCSPHNPVGRVWSEQELITLEQICLRRGVIVVSDEIHSDFTWDGHVHHILAGIDPAFEKNTVICTAPSKTFNLAGLQCSNVFVPDEQLRAKLEEEIGKAGYDLLNAPGLSACKAAYSEGEEWLDQLKIYIQGNIDFMQKFLEEQIPALHMIRPQGTYLVWVDFRSLGLTEEEREELLKKRAKLWLDSGAMFGKDGEGFERFNLACPRSVLEKALIQLRDAVNAV